MKTIGESWIVIGFFVMVSVITIRALKKDAIVRFVSAFCFGFVAGGFIGILFIISESASSGILKIIGGMLGAGIVTGIVASLYGYYFSWLIEIVQKLHQGNT